MIIVNMPDGSRVECYRKRIKDVLRELHLNENSVLVSHNGELVTPDVSLPYGEEITIISVVSGG